MGSPRQSRKNKNRVPGRPAPARRRTEEFLLSQAAPGARLITTNPIRDLAVGRCRTLRKLRYPTEEAAQEALDYALSGGFLGDDLPLGWHYCGYCGDYHLRSKEGTVRAPFDLAVEEQQRARADSEDERRRAKNRAKKKRQKTNRRERKRAAFHGELAGLFRALLDARAAQIKEAEG